MLFMIIQQSNDKRPSVEFAAPSLSAESAAHAEQAQRAHHLLIVYNTRLVLHVVARFLRSRKDITAEELVIEGMQGLHRAVGSFDLGRGVRFSGLAAKWIECQIRASLRRKRQAFGMPSSYESLFVAVCRERQRLLSADPLKYADQDEASKGALLVSSLIAKQHVVHLVCLGCF
jgi:DNA-directed RNA polymerase sigma subunit (sigma70/sigma32)